MRDVTSARPDVFVIGAGVCGLSTAVVLLDAGLSVDVYAADPPHRTTSAAAGALWGPHLVGADERVGPWAARTLRRFRELAAEPAAGITEMAGLVASPGESESEPPAFTSGAGPATSCEPDELPAGFATGWRYAALSSTCFTYLTTCSQLLDKGGHHAAGLRRSDLSEAVNRWTAPIIVNCAGIGRSSVPDSGLTPFAARSSSRPTPGLSEFFVGEREDPAEVTYIFPHGPFVVLGGTQQHDVLSLVPTSTTADRIMKLCVAVEPRLAEALCSGTGRAATRAGRSPA